MNYIRHMNAFFSYVKTDNRLTSSHVSLYMALFQYWNFNRFQNPFPIHRDNMMQLSKIGSKNTYHKCIKELHEAKYIFYHPRLTKFQPVKISVVRLDENEEDNAFKQLDLFNIEESSNPVSSIQNPASSPGTDFDTEPVPILIPSGTDFDTVPVPNMGHTIKHKHFIKESKQPAQKIFDKNQSLSEEVNKLAGVPKKVHDDGSVILERSEGSHITLSEVEEFFKQSNYPQQEARKFYSHYKAIGWKIKGITPIQDWNAAADKWMLNSAKYEAEKPIAEIQPQTDLPDLYNRYLQEQNIFNSLLPDHFDQLNLALDDETMHRAWRQRINQLTGSNQHSVLQLLQAYQDNKENDQLLITDNPNLLTLAKKIAIIKHFNHLKQAGKLSLSG